MALPAEFAALTEARVTINDYEIARALSHEWRHHRSALSLRLARTVDAGLRIPRGDYLAAQGLAEAARRRFPEAMAGCDALLVLGAAGEAPEGLGWTGDSRFQGLWTLLHGPAIGLPAHRGPNGLPIGVQLVAPRDRDAVLLATARWARAQLGTAVALPRRSSRL